MSSPAQIGFMNFDGVDESVRISRNNAYQSLLKHSISVWFKCTTLGGSGTHYLFDTGRHRLGFIQNTNQLRYEISDSPTSDDIRVSGLTITDGQWHHVLVTFDGSTRNANVFYDGSLVFTKNPTNNVSTDPQLVNSVGSGYLGATRFFVGSIDEFAFWGDTDMSAYISDIWNGGKPNDLTLLPTSLPYIYLRMGDGATWNGTDWIFPNLGQQPDDGISRNMEEADRQTDTP
jgi:hypothetical protein